MIAGISACGSFLISLFFTFPSFPPAVMSCEAATQTDVGPGSAVVSGPETEHPVVTLRRGRSNRRPRPSSMVDYQSYRDTKLLVARFLQQQSPCSLTPEVEELINSIKSVLRSDQEHMEEAVRCATLIQQVKHNILHVLNRHSSNIQLYCVFYTSQTNLSESFYHKLFCLTGHMNWNGFNPQIPLTQLNHSNLNSNFLFKINTVLGVTI